MNADVSTCLHQLVHTLLVPAGIRAQVVEGEGELFTVGMHYFTKLERTLYARVHTRKLQG